MRQVSAGPPECLDFWWGQDLLMEQVLFNKPVVSSNSPRISICSDGPATYVVGIILSPGVPSGLFDKNHGKCLIFPSLRLSVTYVVDVFWGQPIKLIQVVSTS